MRFRVFAVLVAVGTACNFGDRVDPVPYSAGLFPSVAYSGYNPKASFRALFSTSAANPQWSVGDPSMATIAPADPPAGADEAAKGLSYALVTMTRAGETTVTARSAGTTLTSRLVIKAYSDDALAAGKARYETGSTDPTRTSCASCHAKPEGVDHSPLKMAGFDDPTILGVIVDATYPPSPTGQSTNSNYAPTGPLSFTGHKWNLTEPERDGILAHLRSLPLK